MSTYLRNNISFVVAGFVTVVALSAIAASTVFFKGSSATELNVSVDEQGHYSFKTREPAFTVIRKYDGEGGVKLSLLESVQTRAYVSHLDGESGEVSMRMRVGDKFKTVAWEKKDAANSAHYEEEIDAVVTTLGGCCGTMDAHRAFDAKTGKLLLSYSEGIAYNKRYNLPFILEIPNSVLAPRLIGVMSPDAARDTDFVSTPSGTDAAALVKYTSRDGGFQKLQIDVKNSPEYGISYVATLVAMPQDGGPAPEIHEGRATLWNADKATDPTLIGGIALKLTLSTAHGEMLIMIPVRNDRLDVEGSSFPAGVTLRPL